MLLRDELPHLDSGTNSQELAVANSTVRYVAWCCGSALTVRLIVMVACNQSVALSNFTTDYIAQHCAHDRRAQHVNLTMAWASGTQYRLHILRALTGVRLPTINATELLYSPRSAASNKHQQLKQPQPQPQPMTAREVDQPTDAQCIRFTKHVVGCRRLACSSDLAIRPDTLDSSSDGTCNCGRQHRRGVQRRLMGNACWLL
jgi:hypothetical protein